MISAVLFFSLGGPSAAKFAGNQLVNLLSLLNNPHEPTMLKMVRATVYRLYRDKLPPQDA